MGLLDELSSNIVTPAPGTSDGGGGGGGDPTNLNSVEAPSTVTITSSTGANAVIPAADASNAGVFLPTEKDKLTNIAAGATANSTDAFLLDRANHTGTQAQSTIVGLATTLGLKADLVGGVVPANQLPAFVDDVLEFASFAALPGTGEAGKIYLTLDDNRQYRWSGSAYVQLNGGLVLGETSATAYRGDRGKAAYDHSLLASGNPHNTTTGDISEVTDKRFLTDAERTAIATNSSKTTNATHTGDVTGSGALAIQPIAVSGKTAGTPASGDVILFARGGVLYSGDVAPFLLGNTDLQGAYDNSPAAEILVVDPFTLKADSGSDVNDVFEIQNTAGDAVFSITGFGAVFVAALSVDGNPQSGENTGDVTLNQNGFTFVSLTGQALTLSAVPQSAVTNLPTDLALKADLVDGKVPSAQIPGSYDDVLEFADFASLPGTGEAGKIYVTIDDNNQYRWSGSIYVQLNGGLALGETAATAYRGDRGKAAYDHSLLASGNPHNVTKTDVGLSNVANVDTTTTANIADSTNKRFVTDAEQTVLGNTSGINTGDQFVFRTIAVSGQNNVVADSTTDTVTYVSGTNMSIATNATTDAITFNASNQAMLPVELDNAASPYAAVDKQRIAALSSTGTININLPASGAAAVIDVSDKDFAAHTNTITITPDGTDTINGLSSLELTTAGAHVGLAIAAGSTDWYLYFFDDNVDSTGTSRNAVLNGDMRVSQENGSVAGTGNTRYPVDQFTCVYVGTQVIESQQVLSTTEGIGDFPAGFNCASKIKVNTADASLAANDYTLLLTRLEGFDVARFGFGRSWARTVTVSFWARSSQTGIYAFSLRNLSELRSYIAEYTILAANTWEKKAITIPGDTTGTWDTSTAIGFDLGWSMGTGTTYQATPNSWQAGGFRATSSSVNWVATLGNTFYLTGVQLEEGLVATEFEHRPYQSVLADCKRYWEDTGGAANIPVTTNVATAIGGYSFKVEKRVNPSLVFTFNTGTGATFTSTSKGGFQLTNHSAISGFSVKANARL